MVSKGEGMFYFPDSPASSTLYLTKVGPSEDLSIWKPAQEGSPSLKACPQLSKPYRAGAGLQLVTSQEGQSFTDLAGLASVSPSHPCFPGGHIHLVSAWCGGF